MRDVLNYCLEKKSNVVIALFLYFVMVPSPMADCINRNCQHCLIFCCIGL